MQNDSSNDTVSEIDYDSIQITDITIENSDEDKGNKCSILKTIWLFIYDNFSFADVLAWTILIYFLWANILSIMEIADLKDATKIETALKPKGNLFGPPGGSLGLGLFISMVTNILFNLTSKVMSNDEVDTSGFRGFAGTSGLTRYIVGVTLLFMYAAGLSMDLYIEGTKTYDENPLHQLKANALTDFARGNLAFRFLCGGLLGLIVSGSTAAFAKTNKCRKLSESYLSGCCSWIHCDEDDGSDYVRDREIERKYGVDTVSLRDNTSNRETEPLL